MPLHAVATTAPGWGSWSFNPIIALALVAASVTYVRMYRRASERAATPPNAGHWVPYAIGIFVLVIALFSPLDDVGDRYLLSAHMMQHTLLSDIAPALLILGLRSPILPLGLSRNALRAVAPGSHSGTSRFLAVATSPWVALPLWALATWVWAIPAVFDYTATHSFVHAIEHTTLFYTGLALWWLIIDPLPAGAAAPERPAPRDPRLQPAGERVRLRPAHLAGGDRIPALRERSAQLRPVGDRRPAPRRRRHVLHRVRGLRARLRGRLHQHAEPLRGADGADGLGRAVLTHPGASGGAVQ